MVGIKLVHVKKNFESKVVLNNINFSVEKGKIMCLLGPSGCGKSSTLKIVAGLLKQDEGEVFLDETLVNEISPEKRGAVIVFQDFLLFPHLNVEENIGFGLKMKGMNKESIRTKVDKMIELMELKGLEKKYPSKLSGGQKQRVALARALAVEPKVLLLDEPFTSLDINIRNSMREFVGSIQRKLNITTILVTHDKEEALMMADTVSLMINGEIIQTGTPEELYENPNSREVAEFFGEANYINGKIKNGCFYCNLGNFILNREIENSENIQALIKPEHINFCDKEEKGLPKGVILEKKYAGDRIYYTVKYNENILKCVEQNSKKFKIGSKVFLNINFNKCVFFKS